ncbi:MAG: GNAT family N-acetyltransferase [Patescibacteria group bacterium]
MEIKKEKQEKIFAIKFTVEDNGKTAGRAYLYLLYNDLHEEPYGFMEDVYVKEEYRGKGAGKQLVEALIQEAKAQGCYKLLGTSRNSRPKVHKFYERFGFEKWGVEFRMNLNH